MLLRVPYNGVRRYNVHSGEFGVMNGMCNISAKHSEVSFWRLALLKAYAQNILAEH